MASELAQASTSADYATDKDPTSATDAVPPITHSRSIHADRDKEDQVKLRHAGRIRDNLKLVSKHCFVCLERNTLRLLTECTIESHRVFHKISTLDLKEAREKHHVVQIASGVCYSCWLPDSGIYGFHGEKGKGGKEVRLELAGQKLKCEFPDVCPAVFKIFMQSQHRFRPGLGRKCLDNPYAFDDVSDLKVWLAQTYQDIRGLQNFVLAVEFLADKILSLERTRRRGG